MRFLLPADFRTQPWKNGGGTTHEIARNDQDGKMIWRLSIAEVTSDGPFSAFPGLSRILTVIEGAGLCLETPDARLDARPLAPVAFSGDLPVSSRMIDGPIRDFNVIYDCRRITAAVTVLRENAATDLAQGTGRHYACLALTPGLSLDGAALPQGAVAMASAGYLQAGPGACGLVTAFAPSGAAGAGPRPTRNA
jgi:uncharacterized protein